MSFPTHHDAIVWNVDKVILTNRTFFGGPAGRLVYSEDKKFASYEDMMEISDEYTRDTGFFGSKIKWFYPLEPL